ncbi:MAG: diguanylate cyclase [Cyanobacteria bacterium J06649_5]
MTSIFLMLLVYSSGRVLQLQIQRQSEFLKDELVIETHEFGQLQREVLRLNGFITSANISEESDGVNTLKLHHDLVKSRITIVEKGLSGNANTLYENRVGNESAEALIKSWKTIDSELLQFQNNPGNTRLKQSVIAQLKAFELETNKFNHDNNRQHWQEYTILIANQQKSLYLLLFLVTAFFSFAVLFSLYVFKFIKIRQQLLEDITRVSTTDELTQIANRRHFNQRFRQEWNRMMREQRHIALVLCDVDHFKRYNDLYGHQAGDECLYQVAQALNQITHRAGDFSARYGGEEFVAILSNTSVKAAHRFAARLQIQIAQLAIAHKASSTGEFVTISIGISVGIPTPEIDASKSLKHADDSLYKAKENGRNQACFYHFTSSEPPPAWQR